MGAVFVIVAAVIAAVNSGRPIYQNFDGPNNSFADWPHISTAPEHGESHKQERNIRESKAEKAAQRLLMQVPLWAGVGTALWGLGDLLAALIA